MLAQKLTFNAGFLEPPKGLAIDLTYWGYVLRATPEQRRFGALLETVSKFTGVILMMSAAGLWLMPASLYGADIIAMKIAATVAFAILGAVLFWNVRNGLLDETQIDLSRAELRTGSRNAGGDFRLRSRLPFADVGSVFLLRSKQADQPTRLFVRFRDMDLACEIAMGAERDMEALRERLARDLKVSLARTPLPPRAA